MSDRHADRAGEIATHECFCEPLDGICRNEQGLCEKATERNVARIAAALADVEREAMEKALAVMCPSHAELMKTVLPHTAECVILRRAFAADEREPK